MKGLAGCRGALVGALLAMPILGEPRLRRRGGKRNWIIEQRREAQDSSSRW